MPRVPSYRIAITNRLNSFGEVLFTKEQEERDQPPYCMVGDSSYLERAAATYIDTRSTPYSGVACRSIKQWNNLEAFCRPTEQKREEPFMSCLFP